MKVRLIFAALLGALALGVPAHAQIQNLLPGGDAKQTIPELRLAGSNLIADDARSLLAQARKNLDERKPVVQDKLDTLDSDIRKLESQQREGAPATDLKPARALRTAYQRELSLYEETISTAQDALARAQSEPLPPAGVVYLDDLLQLQLSAAKSRRQASASTTAAQQARSLAELREPPDKAVTLAQRLAIEEDRLLGLEADLARARALHDQADAAYLSAKVSLHLKSLQIPPEDVAAAAAGLEAVEQQLEQTRESALKSRQENEQALQALRQNTTLDENTRDVRRRLLRARLNLADRRIETAETAQLLAEVRKAALEHMTGQAERIDPVLALEPLETQALALSKVRDAVAVEITQVPGSDAAKTLQSVVEQLDQSIENVRRAQAYATLALEAAGGLHEKLPRGLAWLLTLALIAVALGMWLVISHQLQRLTADEGPIARLLKLRPTVMAQVGLAISATAFIVLATGTAAIAVWAIWRMDVSPSEALRAINNPLFYVDDRGISVFSAVKFAISVAAAVILSRWVRRALTRRIYPAFDMDAGLTNALNTLIKYTFVTVGVLLGLHFVGIGLGSMAFLAGVLGIGIGFGMRNIAENFISGLMILAERPIKIGDWIDIDGQVEGQVRTIRARATTVVTRENISMIIPNSHFIGNRVTNWSHGDPKVRIDIPVGVAYGSDTQLVRKTLREVAEAHGQVLKKPAPDVQFTDFGNSSLDFRMMIWIDQQEHRFRIASDLRFAIDAAFRRKGIEISFPQRDLHIRTMDPRFSQSIRAILHPEEAEAPEEPEPTPKKKEKSKTEPPAKPEKTDKPDKPKLPG